MGFGTNLTGRHLKSDTVNVSTTASTLGTETLQDGTVLGDASNNLSYPTLGDTPNRDGKGPHPGVTRMHIQNLSATAAIYLAPESTVTADGAATGGWYLGPYDIMTFDWPQGDLHGLYFIVASGNARMRVWEETIG